MTDRNDELLLAPWCAWCGGTCRCDREKFPVAANSELGRLLSEAILKAVEEGDD